MRAPRTLKLPPPPEGWVTVWTLCQIGGVHDRTLRAWIEAGLIERPTPHGMNSHYSPRAVLQVRAIKHLRAQGLRRRAFAARVRGASDEALRAIFEPVAKEADVPARASGAAATTATTGSVGAGLGGERWMMVPLLPGVQLMVRDDATAFAVRTAEEIVRQFGAR